jgi:hypothetical protein
MVKFLIALAEMFSAFSAKLHDMSEDMPAQLTEDDVREIVQEEISTESISTDDVVGLERYVSDALEEYDASSKVDERLFYLAVQNLVWTYCNSRGIDTNEVYIHSEEWAMQRYLEGRAVDWRASVKEREERTKARIIKEYEKQRQTIALGDSTTTVDVKI